MIFHHSTVLQTSSRHSCLLFHNQLTSFTDKDARGAEEKATAPSHPEKNTAEDQREDATTGYKQ